MDSKNIDLLNQEDIRNINFISNENFNNNILSAKEENETDQERLIENFII